MSANKYKNHLLVLPEDDANRQIANGFLLNPNLKGRIIQILPPAGGWIKVLDSFKKNHVPNMKKCQQRMMLLLIDFDLKENRLDQVKDQIPATLKDRVFVLGVQSEPENLKKKHLLDHNTFEEIGKSLAQDCVNGTDKLWGHDLLKQNKTELERMILCVKPFLFNLPISQ